MALYRIRDKHDDNIRLVKAPSKAQALRFVAEDEYEVDLPSAEEAAILGGQGVTVEDAMLPREDVQPDLPGMTPE